MSVANQLFIDGDWRAASDGPTIPVLDPATGAVIDSVPRATESDVTDALRAAERAFASWRYSPVAERAAVLADTARRLREREDEIAGTLTAEQGKPIAEAHVEVRQAADQFDWYAGEARRVYGRLVEVDPDHQVRVERRPIGAVAAFTAWNFPITLPARKIAPAIAAGCSIVLKPAEESPRTACLLAAACSDAGVPPGVVNVVTGEPAAISAQLLASPVIRKVTLTGSIPVGRELVRGSAQHLPSLSLELGGHAPVLVLDDADLDQAVDACVRAKFRNAGQVCISPTRFLVGASVVEEFTTKFVAATRKLVVGPGHVDGVQVGPLANERRRDAVERIVADALDGGAELLCGGRRPPDLPDGFFFEPTVLANVHPSMAVMREEPFGPIAPILAFDDLDEALAIANGVPHGLAAYVFTSGLRSSKRVTDRLEAGMIGVNEVALALSAARRSAG